MSAPFARLGLEQLADRNAPSSFVGNSVATTDWMGDQSETWVPAYVGHSDGDSEAGWFSDPPANQKPKIENFTCTIGNGWVGTFTGRVVDESPSGLTVVLNGVQQCMGNGVSVTTDENGNFTFQAELRQQLDTGPSYADVSDSQGLAADQVDYFVVV